MQYLNSGQDQKAAQGPTKVQHHLKANKADLVLRWYFADCSVSIKTDDLSKQQIECGQSTFVLFVHECTDVSVLCPFKREHQCVLPAEKKSSRYQQPRFAIMFPPLTHSACLMIWVLKPEKLPSPKPDILQFVSHLLLPLLPHYCGPLPHFPSPCNIPQPPPLSSSSFYIVIFSPNVFPRFQWNGWLHILLLCFHTHTYTRTRTQTRPLAFLYGELMRKRTHLHFPSYFLKRAQHAISQHIVLYVCVTAWGGTVVDLGSSPATHFAHAVLFVEDLRNFVPPTRNGGGKCFCGSQKTTF